MMILKYTTQIMSITMWIVVAITCLHGWVRAESVQDTISQWEQNNGMTQWLISNWPNIDAVLVLLENNCAITGTMRYQITTNVNDTLTQIWLTLTKATAPQYYQAYQQWHEAAASYRDSSQYCIYKIAAYQLQQRFYKVYDWSEQAVNPVRTNYAYRVKYFDTLQTLIDKYQQPSESAYPLLSISVSNRSDVLAMQPITKKVAWKMSLLYRNIIMDSLKNLKNDGILTTDAIDSIGSKIMFEYVNQCDQLRGLTKVTLSRNKLGRTLSTSLNSITFNVNVCEDVSYIANFDSYIKDLVYHELAHYIYYIDDKSYQQFESLCRSTDLLNTCKRSDFVTDYARSGPQEDYAETFQHRYQSKGSFNNTINKKFRYFDQLFDWT